MPDNCRRSAETEIPRSRHGTNLEKARRPLNREGAATWAALKHLAGTGWIASGERVVLFNTGSGLKYL